MEYSVIKVEKKENYAIITFNRPEKFNAANAQIFSELASAVRELDADPEVGCMILTGQTFTHPKKGTPFPVFSAGADVEQFASIGKTEAGFDFIKVCICIIPMGFPEIRILIKVLQMFCQFCPLEVLHFRCI